MKTVRQNVFETNSSSTHSVTLCVRSGATPTMKPYSAGDVPVTVKISQWGYDGEDEGWQVKLGMLAAYLKTIGNLDRLEQIRSNLEKFAGFPISIDQESLDKLPTVSDQKRTEMDEDGCESEADDYVRDIFSYFINEYYGHETVGDFRHAIDSVIEDDDTALAFLCSTGWFDVQGYYDG